MSTIVRIAIFSLRNKRLYLFGLCLFPAMLSAQGYEKNMPGDTLGKTFADTGQVTQAFDSVAISPSALGSEVHYTAKDSIIFDMLNKRAYLYGDAHIDYENLTLDADFITIDWTTNVICAEGLPDSSGKLAGTPVFKEADKTYKSKTLCYNFKTKSGRITEVITQEGEEAYYHSVVSKMVKDGDKDVIFVKNGTYTTCNLHDPHFGIFSPKMKVMPNDKVITSFAYLKVEKVPMPLALPFGFFPANTKKTSGLIIPQIGNARSRGFVLREGGFYFGGSEYFDLALTGDIYTRGMYRANLSTNYAKRYRFNGFVSLEYSRIDNLELPDTRNYQIAPSYNVRWTHRVNPKARPGTTFSANVNAGSPAHFRQTNYDAQQILNPTMNSSIFYGKSFKIGNAPFNLGTTLEHNQNINTGYMDMDLPNIVLSMQRVNPFKPKVPIKKRWYHDLGLTGTLQMDNKLISSDSTIQDDLDIKKFNNYMTGAFPLSTTIPVFKYVNFNPSISANTYLYTRRIERFRDLDSNEDIIKSTEQGLYGFATVSSRASLSTTIYGLANLNKGRLDAIRHRIIPEIGLNYTPNLAKSAYGEILMDTGSTKTRPYFLFDNGIAPAPSQGENASLSFNLNNNLEMKVKPKNGDTTKPVKKIRLIDQFNISSFYDFLADSMHLRPVTFSLTTTLFDKLTINAGTALDPYTVDRKGRRINKWEWDETKRPGRFTTANINFSTSLNGAASENTSPLMYINDPYTGFYYNRPYANFSVPWNLGVNYTINYSKPAFEATTNKLIGINASFTLTKNWKLSGSTNYDITNDEFNLSVIDIYRDLHCWEMSMHWIPFGRYQSYFFNIRIKASALSDLKLDKRDQWSEPDEE